MYTGTYRHNLDTAGRFVMPQELRNSLGMRFYLTKGLGCLWVFTDEWIHDVKKELEFDDRGKDLQAARAEIAGLSSRIADVEGQLAQARSELEKTTGLLMDVTELSAGLEEKLNPYVQTKKDRNKADELKRKVEVLMSPEK